MQDVHPINGGGGGGGRLFGDRRIRPHLHPNNHHSLKCPRCDSSNTKFCYYNNYNLSQPRHFCKNCRRYWTKGGVLRNVPVGGGCRKSKRSSKPKTAKHPSTKTTTKTTTTTSVSHSSSESSNNNNNNTVTASAVAAVNCNSGRRDLFQISDADQNFSIRNLDTFTKNNLNNNNNKDWLFSGELMDLMSNDHSGHHLFDGAGNGTATTKTTTASFGQFSAAGAHNWDMVKLSGANEVENDDKMSGVLDQTVTIDDLLQNRGSSVGIATLDDWQHPTAENDHQGLFDFSSTVDHQEYWSQSTATVQDHHTHWSHNSNDHPLFLP